METVAAIEKAGGKALFRAGDVCDSAQLQSLIADTVKKFGGLDILVNSAGVRTNGSITEITERIGTVLWIPIFGRCLLLHVWPFLKYR